jgi:hypothetical protein
LAGNWFLDAEELRRGEQDMHFRTATDRLYNVAEGT